MHFDSATGKLTCDYCGTSYEVAEIEALFAEKEQKAAEAKKTADQKTAQQKQQAQAEGWDTSDLGSDWGQDAAGMKSYSCPSLRRGAHLRRIDRRDRLPLLRQPQHRPRPVLRQPQARLSFCPSSSAKDDAVKALKAHYKGKPFLPRQFTNENHVQEIKGVYVPFWMFDGKATGSCPATSATRSRCYTSGDYEVTETDHFDIFREGSIAFEKVPVDASSKMPDDYMDSIEPFDYKELKHFSTAYLPGFLADKYDVSVEDCHERADTRCEGSLVAALGDTVTGYDSCVPVSHDVKLRRGKVHYALLPVWLLSTKWQGKNYLFAMNGQTGKLVGDLPTSAGKFWGTFAAISAVLTALISAGYLLFA